eukprot:TRINITY_DN9512_c0_g1_i1.p3 TRINITY_DN9512_c0_g1~~TRINITY_DN9512_c0_g1_i1.p3  ORF type:complete len:166 (+),score=46.67 TRINITY_DN9512_c0_g1_i1:59-499(+)
MLSLADFEGMSFASAQGRVQNERITRHTSEGMQFGAAMRLAPFMAARPDSAGMSYDELLRLDEDNVKIGVKPEEYRRAVVHRRATAKDCTGADPITQDTFRKGAEIAEIKRCKHIFQPEGLKKWFKKEHNCPVCRVDVREKGAVAV